MRRLGKCRGYARPVVSETVGRSLSARALVALWLVVFAGLVVVGRGLRAAFDWPSVAYDRIAESAETLIRHGLIGEILFAIALCALVTWLGWWRPVLIERRRVSRSYLLDPRSRHLSEPAVHGLGRLESKGAGFVLVLVLTTLLVGLNEELFARGVLLVGVRRLTSEAWVWCWTSLAFGALHAVNLAAESPRADVIGQILIVTLLSTLFYLARRAAEPSMAMVMHGAWDFSQLSQPIDGGATAARVTLGLLVLALLIGSLATARRWLRVPAAA